MTSMSQWAAGPLTFAAALLLGGPAGALHAADPGEAAAPEFAFVPADAAAVVSVRFGDLWNNEALRPARDRLLKDQSDEVTMFTERTGLELGELDRVTAAYGSGGDGTIFLATARPYDHKKVAAAAAKGAQEQKVNDRTLYLHGDGAATILLLDANTLVIGTAENVRALAKRNGPAPKGALTPALRAGAEKRLVLVAWDAAALSAITQPPFPEFAPLMKAELAVLAADLNGQDLAGRTAPEIRRRGGRPGRQERGPGHAGQEPRTRALAERPHRRAGRGQVQGVARASRIEPEGPGGGAGRAGRQGDAQDEDRPGRDRGCVPEGDGGGQEKATLSRRSSRAAGRPRLRGRIPPRSKAAARNNSGRGNAQSTYLYHAEGPSGHSNIRADGGKWLRACLPPLLRWSSETDGAPI